MFGNGSSSNFKFLKLCFFLLSIMIHQSFNGSYSMIQENMALLLKKEKILIACNIISKIFIKV